MLHELYHDREKGRCRGQTATRMATREKHSLRKLPRRRREKRRVTTLETEGRAKNEQLGHCV